MRCPKCGKMNDDQEMYCTSCHAPLGNTSYRPLPRKKSRRKRALIIIPLVLIILLIAGIFGYRFLIKTGCLKVTDMIFEHGRTLDFSDIDKNKLPDALKKQPNARILVEEELKDLINSSPIGKLVSVDNLDLDPIIDEIVKDGEYEVVKTQVSWNRCRVTIRTSNTDFSKILETLTQVIKEDATASDSDLREALIEQFKGLNPFNKDEEAPVDWGSLLLDYYQKAKEQSPRMEKEGVITYGFEGMNITGWTIIDYDRDLIRGFYGIDIPDQIFDSFMGASNDKEK